MNLYDAFVILLEATVDQNDEPLVRRARARVAKKVESLRLKKERASQREQGVVNMTYVPAWVEPLPPSN
jgi:hypothetical protein